MARAPFLETTLTSDTLMNVWALRELTHQLLTDPLHLLDGNAFHPYTRDTLALVDHMLANAVLVAPLWLLTKHALFIYNAAVLATFALTGFLTYKLVVRLCGSSVAGLIAGVAFAFSSARWHQLTHLHAASTQWLPLALLTLHALLEQPTRPRLAAFSGAAVLVVLSSWHLALFGGFSVAVIAVWTLVGDGRPIGRRLGMLTVAAVVVFVGLLPLAAAYARAAGAWRLDYTATERAGELQNHSLSLEGLVATSGATRVAYAPTLARFGDGEWRGFPGLVTAALATLSLLRLWRTIRGAGLLLGFLALIGGAAAVLGLGIVLARRGDPALAATLAARAPVVVLSLALLVAGLWGARRAGRLSPAEHPDAPRLRLVTLGYVAMVVVGALLSLGPSVRAVGVDIGSGIFREDWLPVLSILRTPGRFVMLVALGAAVLAGLGTTLIADRLRGPARVAVLGLLLVVLNLDLRLAPIQLAAAPQANRNIHVWLARAPETGSVIEYPLGRSLSWMYLSPAHGRPLVNGSGYVQPHMFSDVKAVPDFSRAQLELLWEHFHPRFAVLRGESYAHRPEEYAAILAAVKAQPEALEERARFGDDVVFELTDQGRGPSLFRRWPREALARARELTLTALVSETAPGARSDLEVLLNGRTLLRAEGAADHLSLHTAAYDREWLVPGVNTFEIRGDYRLAAETPARPIGTTGVDVRADVAIASSPEYASIRINGRVLGVEKGYTLVALDADSGAVRAVGTFNTSWHTDDSDRLVRFVGALPDRSPVVVASEFDVSRALTEEAVSALKSLGLREDMRGRFNVLHAALGVKGAAAGTALEAVDARAATVTLGSPQARTVQLNGLSLR